MSWLRERADVTIADKTFTVLRDSMLKGSFALKWGEQVAARARKTSLFTRSFDVETGGEHLRLAAVSIWRREFGVYRNGEQIGRIAPTSLFRRSAVIDLPDDVPLPVQVFLFWLVIILWRRSANSNAAGH